MSKYLLKYSVPQIEVYEGDTIEDAIDDLLDVRADAVVDREGSMSQDAANKIILQALQAAGSGGLNCQQIVEAGVPEEFALDALGDLHDDGILLRKNTSRNYFICASGRDKANRILAS